MLNSIFFGLFIVLFIISFGAYFDLFVDILFKQPWFLETGINSNKILGWFLISMILLAIGVMIYVLFFKEKYLTN